MNIKIRCWTYMIALIAMYISFMYLRSFEESVVCMERLAGTVVENGQNLDKEIGITSFKDNRAKIEYQYKGKTGHVFISECRPLKEEVPVYVDNDKVLVVNDSDKIIQEFIFCVTHLFLLYSTFVLLMAEYPKRFAKATGVPMIIIEALCVLTVVAGLFSGLFACTGFDPSTNVSTAKGKVVQIEDGYAQVEYTYNGVSYEYDSLYIGEAEDKNSANVENLNNAETIEGSIIEVPITDGMYNRSRAVSNIFSLLSFVTAIVMMCISLVEDKRSNTV